MKWYRFLSVFLFIFLASETYASKGSNFFCWQHETRFGGLPTFAAAYKISKCESGPNSETGGKGSEEVHCTYTAFCAPVDDQFKADVVREIAKYRKEVLKQKVKTPLSYADISTEELTKFMVSRWMEAEGVQVSGVSPSNQVQFKQVKPRVMPKDFGSLVGYMSVLGCVGDKMGEEVLCPELNDCMEDVSFDIRPAKAWDFKHTPPVRHSPRGSKIKINSSKEVR